MSDRAERLARLSPEKRALLERALLARREVTLDRERIRRRAPGEAAPLSFPQQRLWFFDRMAPGDPTYNAVVAIALRGPLDIDRLHRAFIIVVDRHEAVRTVFPDREGIPYQHVLDDWELALDVVDLRACPDAQRAGELAAILRDAPRAPYDLRADLMLRLLVVRTGDDEHVLLIMEHHIAFDGWSDDVLCAEVSECYRALGDDRIPRLAELPVQYGDYAVWQRRWLAGPVLEAQLAYWTARLAGAPPLLELPTDHPRPALRSYRGAAVSLSLDSALGAALHGLALRLAATPFMLLAGGFAALLARYSGQEDVVLGTPIANRPHAELEELIGFFANTLCLRTDLTGAPDLAQLVSRVRETALGAYAHQDLPFERLVEALRPERDLRHSPVFQVMLTLQNLPRLALELPGLALSSFEVDGGRAQFDLTLTLYPGPDSGLFARLDYALDLFDAATASRLLAHLKNLLAGMAAHPEARIAELPLLAPEERQELLAAGNDTAAPVPDGSVASLFVAVAASQPDAVAVTQEGESLSYGELEARSNRLAHHLHRQGVGPETRVAVCVERSPALLVALLGVLQADGVYVPLDPSYPADRLAWIVADSGAALLLTTADLAAALPSLPIETAMPPMPAMVVLDALELAEGGRVPPPWEGEGWVRGEARRGAPPSPDSLAYVIYTSGSTGRPKGVAIASRGMVNFLASMARRPGLGATDVLVAVTTLAFDIAVLELFLPLVVGARVELADRETAGDGQRLAARLAACGATVLQATPSTWRLLLEAGWEGAPHLTALCGGEALPPELARTLASRTRALWNVYGPTETTVWSAVHPVAAADLEGRPIPLGAPIANTALHLLGRFEHGLPPVPPGVVGELYLGGAGLARGYLGRPDLTAERFVPDPFAASPGARLYRTGDLVRRRSPQGELEILGRVDHQVKLRGFRIELGEIEAVLGGDPAVRQCAVVVREDGGVRRLVAYLALRDGLGGLGSLDAVLRGKLPDYMVPHLLVALPELPLTPNGKLDRRALLALPAPEGAAAAEHVAPRNPAEALLAAVWAEVLRLDRVSVHANFFTLGGDSILAMRAVTRSRARGLRFTPRQLFQNQTVAQLAAVAEVAVEPSAEPAPVPTAELPLAHLAPADLADVLAELGDE